ncbi:hypothetical protein [Ilumatobacter sp.]|uniref:hypothetical protein n=1 Tax=Ilumatobacter sp. TaxID=1967498 RepID=UPI003B520385
MTPNSVHVDGTCPRCGDVVQLPEGVDDPEALDESAPWHFKLMVVAITAYLAWRLVSLVA